MGKLIFHVRDSPIDEQSVSSSSVFSFKQWGADGVKQSKYTNGKLLKGEGRQMLPV